MCYLANTVVSDAQCGSDRFCSCDGDLACCCASQVAAFSRILRKDFGIFCSVRKEMGQDISGAGMAVRQLQPLQRATARQLLTWGGCCGCEQAHAGSLWWSSSRAAAALPAGAGRQTLRSWGGR